jgi:hypothetical protein
MASEFQPSFNDFQKDIERYIISIGKRERTKDGMMIFWGYYDAEKMMFRRYLDHGAFDPLVAHFRSWNWEVGYNDYLLELTTALVTQRDWPLLQRLWDGVIAKRRKFYNEVWKIEKDDPGTLPSKTVTESRERLLETLRRVQAFAEELGQPGDVDKYAKMIGRVQRGRKA